MRVSLIANSRVGLFSALLVVAPVVGRGDTTLPLLGGPGGGVFEARCPQGEVLRGFDLKTGDDVDAVRPLCASAVAVGSVGPLHDLGAWNGGNGGPNFQRLTCPSAAPVVVGLYIRSEGERTIVVNNVHLFCGVLTRSPQPRPPIAGAYFDGPDAAKPGFGAPYLADLRQNEVCEPDQVAVGVVGRSGVWLDALGLVCDQGRRVVPIVHSIGRAHVPS